MENARERYRRSNSKEVERCLCTLEREECRWETEEETDKGKE
jgi:hypothetical protein